MDYQSVYLPEEREHLASLVFEMQARRRDPASYSPVYWRNHAAQETTLSEVAAALELADQLEAGMGLHRTGEELP